MKDLIEYVVKTLVDHPDELRVDLDPVPGKERRSAACGHDAEAEVGELPRRDRGARPDSGPRAEQRAHEQQATSDAKGVYHPTHVTRPEEPLRSSAAAWLATGRPAGEVPPAGHLAQRDDHISTR